MRKTYAIVQARMGSTRLPGKVMKVVTGKPLLYLMVERLRRAEELNGIIIATTDKEADLPIVELVDSLDGVLLFRGPEEDVLSRYYAAAVYYNVESIVRLTADCPLIDAGVTDRVIRAYHEQRACIDYASNTGKRTYPRGLDVEVFSFTTLSKAFREATLQPDREHVTPYIWRHPYIFRLLDVVDDTNRSHMRWTVDTPEDLELISRIYEELYPVKPDFSYHDVLQLLQEHPDWNMINSHIEQKAYGQ